MYDMLYHDPEQLLTRTLKGFMSLTLLAGGLGEAIPISKVVVVTISLEYLYIEYMCYFR